MCRAKLLFLIILLSLSSSLQATAPRPNPPEYYKCDVKAVEVADITPELIALSEFIAEGIIISPTKQIQSHLSSKNYKYIVSSFVHINSLKGELKYKKISISHFAREQQAGVCIKNLLEHDKKKVIVFLVRPDEFSEGYFYYAGHRQSAFSTSSQEKVEHIKTIFKQQSQALKNFDQNKMINLVDKVVHNQVKTLINRALDTEFQQSSFDELAKLGKPAVPSIILLMNDFRGLPNPHTSSPNRLYYGPDVVVDGLSTILSYLTGKSLSSISNGGTARERKHAIDAWRLYLTDFK